MVSNSIQTDPSYSSSTCSTQQKYEVFLSFRGETRNSFTEHLYRALIDKGIITFKDDIELEWGSPISPEISYAIKNSKIAVVILSKNYASSTWCLQELAKIVECMEGGLRVLPIFYLVDPSHVRHQKKSFAKAFAKHEKDFKENPEKAQILQKWRAALRYVANLSGRSLDNRSSEAEFIRNIVEWVSEFIYGTRSFFPENGLVGIGSRVEEMNSYLGIKSNDEESKDESNDVRFIGICGMSGMGKTTLVKVVFNKIRDKFDASSFLEDVREASKDTSGLEKLQNQLLRDMKLKSNGGLQNNIQVISNELRKKRVLIVVDDVSKKEQLETLVGKPDWFGPKSRIIITTVDKHLLVSYKIQVGFSEQEAKIVCNVKGLNNDDALQLFSLNAFPKPHCENDFLDLCKDFVNYAQGIPLVLKVLGSHLCTKTKKEWESTWNQLRAIPDEEITKKLQITFDGLDTYERKLFLDIACFFKGEDRNRVADILESVCYSHKNIRNLINKSLITIVGGKLWMHNLLQVMGWEIVREESEEPERRSRLWLHDDVLDVLNKNTGTNKIEGMVLKLPPNEEEELNAESFSNMNKLRLLRICKVRLPCLNNLSNELRLLEWHDYPLESLPKSFQPRKLVELIMHRSCIQQLPSGFRNLGKLKLIDLSDSQNLTQTPNFIEIPNIERLNFQGCTRLRELHPSFGGLKQLIQLNLKDCKCLDDLPHELNLESLKILILSGCSKLKKFPEIGSNMTSLLELYLDRTAIEELPSSIKHLTGLTLLSLQDCKNLWSFPSVICSLTSLKILILKGCKSQQPIEALQNTGPEPEPINLLLPISFPGLSSLVSLDLSDCNLSDGALPDDLSCLYSIKSLNLSKNNFTSLPDSISELSELKLLLLDHCRELKSLPYLPLSTQFVSARGCSSLENYSNQVVVWTSGDAGFTFIDCLGLADDEGGKITEISLLDIHFKPLWQKFMEKQILQIEGFYSVVPQTEIPVWFNHRSSESVDSLPIKLPDSLFNDKSWKGIALCVIFVVHTNSNDAPPGQDSTHFHKFICRLDMDGGLKDCPLVYKVPKRKFHVGSFGLWLFISHARFRDHLDERSCISPLIKTDSQDIEIKMCGARILYEEVMVEFVQKSTEKTFLSLNDLHRPCHDKYTQDPSNFQSLVDEVESRLYNGQSESDSRLKRHIKSLLSRLYRVDYARKHWYDYIFPHDAIPPTWFSDQNFGHFVNMELPPNLHDNSAWLGFTVYAFYTIQKQRDGLGYKQDSRIFLHFSGLSDEVPHAPYMAFPLTRDDFDESSAQLLMFYIPCVLFKLNQCSYIGVIFESNDPVVEVKMCGICIVYEQNVEEFVQTLVEHMIGCPEKYHDSIVRNLFNQVGMIQDCNHEKDNFCSFSPERRFNPMPMLLPSTETIQEEGTSRETFSNQVIAASTSKSSSRGSTNLGIPFVNWQYGSNISSTSTLNLNQGGSIKLGIPFGHGKSGTNLSTSLESWFQLYLKDRYKQRSAFNHCFPQREIPEWFGHPSDGFSMRILLPPDFYDNPDWMGFAFCAVFAFHKHPTAVRDNLDKGSSHHLICCQLKTNLGPMTPLHYLIREEDVLISLCRRVFIWVSFIPRGILSLQLSRCSWVEFFFVSDSPDVSPQDCGANLLYQHNLQQFTNAMVQCLTSYLDYLYAIRISCKQDIVFVRLPFSSDKLSRNYSYEKVYEKRHSTGRETTTISGYKTGALDFNLCTSYNFCFPPSKIHEWFSHKNHGHSVTIDLPSNLYHDNNWMGLILYASFSVRDDLYSILNYLVSGIPHFLYCQCQTSMANVSDEIISCYTSREEIAWLLNICEFIWISYVPVELFKNLLQYCNHIEASFVSDWPGVIVQKCALHLLFQHDQVLFEQELRHCNDLILEQREIVRKHSEDYEKKRNEQSGVDEKKIFSTSDFEVQLIPRFIDQSKTNETKTKLGKSDLLDFDQCRVYNSCFPLCEIPEWFSHQSDESPVTIPLPPNVFNDNTWMGLVLCASIAVEASPTAIVDIQNSETSYNLICHLETNIECVEPLHVHHITEKDNKLLQQAGFIWLSYIPRGSFKDLVNQCSRIEASVATDCPGLVQKCGFHLLYKHDVVEFQETIRQCIALFSNEHEVSPKKSSSSSDQGPSS